jgi:hypothetical protein
MATKKKRPARKAAARRRPKAKPRRASSRSRTAPAAKTGSVFTAAEQFGLDARDNSRGNAGRHNGEGVVTE